MKGLLLKSTLVSFLDQLSSTKEKIKPNKIISNLFSKKKKKGKDHFKGFSSY